MTMKGRVLKQTMIWDAPRGQLIYYLLHPDEEVTLTGNSDGDFSQVLLDNGKLGWILSETIQPIPQDEPFVSQSWIDLIREQAVGSRAYYEATYRQPVWDGGNSGVKIGIGYDLGYTSPSRFWSDWHGRISDRAITALSGAIGIKGEPAETLARRLGNVVDIPFSVAMTEFTGRELPKLMGRVRRALPNTGRLSPDALGALTSLVYNRGASFARPGDRYAEMRNIKDSMANLNVGEIPSLLRNMKRLWPAEPQMQALREREAQIFEGNLSLDHPLTYSPSRPSRGVIIPGAPESRPRFQQGDHGARQDSTGKEPRSDGALAPPLGRYANVALLPFSGSAALARGTSLTPSTVFRLRLDIGALSNESQVENPQALPVAGKAELDVMVSSTDFAVASDADGVAEGKTDHVVNGRFLLPADGGAATTPDGDQYLTIYLRAPSEKGVARCRIGYYFHNAPVQSQLLIAAIGEAGGFSIRTDFTLSETLSDLAAIPERPRLSVITNDNDSGMHQIVIRQADGTTTKGTTFPLPESTVAHILGQLRSKLTHGAPGQKRRSRRELIEDLNTLAPLGRSLYVQIPGLRDALLDVKDKTTPFLIHVARPPRSKFVLPWGLCYDIPLDSQKKLSLCPMVEQWDDRKPLFAEAPHACPYDHARSNILCPFGFIGFRYAIEQPQCIDKPMLTIACTPRCDFAVAETQDVPDLKVLEAHIAKLRGYAQSTNPPTNLAEGKTRDAVQKMLGADLSLVYFFCHGKRPWVGDPNTCLAVGNDESISAEDLTAWFDIWANELRRRIWGDIRPLIFINACHSLAIEPETLVSYLDAFVTWGHAAGVIGTEVKVAQPLAMDVAEQFFRRLLARTHTVETALHEIRLDYLAQGNLFGLVYTPYCWADLRLE